MPMLRRARALFSCTHRFSSSATVPSPAARRRERRTRRCGRAAQRKESHRRRCGRAAHRRAGAAGSIQGSIRCARRLPLFRRLLSYPRRSAPIQPRCETRDGIGRRCGIEPRLCVHWNRPEALEGAQDPAPPDVRLHEWLEGFAADCARVEEINRRRLAGRNTAYTELPPGSNHKVADGKHGVIDMGLGVVYNFKRVTWWITKPVVCSS